MSADLLSVATLGFSAGFSAACCVACCVRCARVGAQAVFPRARAGAPTGEMVGDALADWDQTDVHLASLTRTGPSHDRRRRAGGFQEAKPRTRRTVPTPTLSSFAIASWPFPAA